MIFRLRGSIWRVMLIRLQVSKHFEIKNDEEREIVKRVKSVVKWLENVNSNGPRLF